MSCCHVHCLPTLRTLLHSHPLPPNAMLPYTTCHTHHSPPWPIHNHTSSIIIHHHPSFIIFIIHNLHHSSFTTTSLHVPSTANALVHVHPMSMKPSAFIHCHTQISTLNAFPSMLYISAAGLHTYIHTYIYIYTHTYQYTSLYTSLYTLLYTSLYTS